MKTTTAVLATLFAFGLSLSALAHAHLDSADPPQGAVLSDPPEAVSLVFTEALELALSSVTLADAEGNEIGLEAPENEEGDPRSLRVTLPALTPGVYTVAWTVTSVDTHSTSGTYSFTLN